MFRFPPRRIVVPLDLTPASERAWRHAKALAARFSAALDVVHFEELPPAVAFEFGVPPMSRRFKSEIAARVRKLAGSAARVHVLEGDPAAGILSYARKHHPDLIVMGTHGRTGLERFWLGSVAEAVVWGSPAPVLIARGEPGPLKRVLAPVNFTEYSDYGFACAARIATGLGAHMTALHAYKDFAGFPSPYFRLRALIDQLPRELRESLKPSAEARHGVETEVILSAMQTHDWVVLVEHKGSILRDLALGTTAERVIRRAKASVLVIPEPKPKGSHGLLEMAQKEFQPAM